MIKRFWEGRMATYNHPAYSFKGCSARWASTIALAGPVATGWRSASGWEEGMIASERSDLLVEERR